jgi:hypothetical protein
MKTNHLYILLIVVYIISSSCTDKYRYFTDLFNYRIINLTNNALFCEITNSTNDSTETNGIYVNSNDSADILFSNTKYISQYKVHWYYSFDILFCIYNLNDTSKIKQSMTLRQSGKFIDNEWIFENKNDKPEKYIDISDGSSGSLSSYFLFINIDKLPLFEKDYSMLEKFPEYYGN